MNQSDIELKVFKEFANIAPINIVPATIEHRNPPEPDICCKVEGQGQVGFELTELIDREHMERTDLMFKTKDFIYKFLEESLPTGESNKFVTKYDNALLHFVFDINAGMTKRETVIALAIQKLFDIKDGFEGDAIKGDADLLPILECVRISRGSFVGPIIDVDSIGWLGDPTERTLQNKLSKKYECTYPIELIAYINWNLLPPNEAWMAAADKAMKYLKNSQFRKVWVINLTKKVIEYVRP